MRAGRWTDGQRRQTDITKPTVALCNFANAPKNEISERRHAVSLSRIEPETPRLWNGSADC